MTGNLKPFTIHVGDADDSTGITTVTLSGYLDAHTVTEFEAAVERLTAAGGARLIIDVSALNYISSAGIGALMGLVQELRRHDGEFVLLNPTDSVHRMLEVLGFVRIFRIAGDPDEARDLLADND